MKEILLKILSSFGYPVFLQGTLNADEAYPESFITFFVSYSEDNAHYDDEVHSIDWHISVIFYSSSPKLVNTKPFEILKALKNAGFIPQGKGNDLISDEPTHTGWAIDYRYIEIQ